MMNRIVGLLMFTFILFGLVNLFFVTRIAHTSVPAIVSIVFTIGFGTIYCQLLVQDTIVNASVVPFSAVLPSLAFSIFILLAYIAAIVLFIIGEVSGKRTNQDQ